MTTQSTFLKYLVLPLSLILCIVFTINVLNFNYIDELPEGTMEVVEVHYISNNGIQSLSDSGYGDVVLLPHSWRTDYDHHVAWYTALIPLPSVPSRPQALYFPDISVDSTVYLNDQILGSVLRPNETRGRMGRRPLLLRVPVGLWLKGDNELNIRVSAEPQSLEWLNKFYAGSESDLSDVYSRHVFRSVSVVKLMALLLAFTALGMGVVWLYRPKDVAYGWYAIVCTTWSGVTLAEISDAVFLDYELPVWFGTVLFFVFCLALYKFVEAGRVRNQARRYKNYFVFLMIACATTALLNWQDQPLVYLAVSGMGIAFLVAACCLSVFAQSKSNFADRLFLMVTLIMLTTLAFKSWLIAWTTPGLAFSGLSTAIVAPAFVFLIGYQLIRDFVSTRNQLEILNQNLEQRVLERTNELKVQHLKLLEFEKKQVLSGERDRIMLEMHDGMGAHLVSILSMTDRENIDMHGIQNSVRDALQDLRMMIDSLDPVDNDLGLVLGMYRQRIQRALKDSKIDLQWDISEFPLISDLTPHRVLQILRILQEAVSNAIKYSNSTRIRVSNGVKGELPFIQVQDFGQGLDEGCAPGRGLHNMRKRAQSIGADLSLNSGPEGLAVTLVLPLEADSSKVA